MGTSSSGGGGGGGNPLIPSWIDNGGLPPPQPSPPPEGDQIDQSGPEDGVGDAENPGENTGVPQPNGNSETSNNPSAVEPKREVIIVTQLLKSSSIDIVVVAEEIHLL